MIDPGAALDVLTRARVEKTLDEVLSRPELDLGPSWLEQLRDWFAERFSPGTAELLESAAWILAISAGTGVLVLGGWLLRQRLQPGRARVDEAPEADVRARRVAELRARARAARAAGDDRLALRLTLFALVVGLGEAGNLRYRDAWTNRELVRRGRPKADVKELLESLVDELEPKDFGAEPIEPGDLDRLEELCERWIGPAARAAGAVRATGAAGGAA